MSGKSHDCDPANHNANPHDEATAAFSFPFTIVLFHDSFHLTAAPLASVERI
jgi:hypothetical protein